MLNFEAPLVSPNKNACGNVFCSSNEYFTIGFLTYGSATVANNSQVQPSSHSYNTDSSKLASSSATSSPSPSLLYTKVLNNVSNTYGCSFMIIKC
ncbi:hypothetical protein LOK49_LG12G00386 [Camellia lanceoleosa]|uniref:Uncharacterized protein n=1 Tax=Camellia lanceoleosa TaxID=1840588 RepID=A0ACC0FS58_9ERIC|nr:hypothetical protein LOK49_LG12G00386 [Camellia lanceoleosa]